MYRMDTRLKQAPLLIQAVPTTTSTMTTPGEKPAEKPLAVPTFVSRGLQTDLEVQPTNASSSQMHYYEKEQSQVRPVTSDSAIARFATLYAGRSSVDLVELQHEQSGLLPPSASATRLRAQSFPDRTTAHRSRKSFGTSTARIDSEEARTLESTCRANPRSSA